jgi:hypothetical protein
MQLCRNLIMIHLNLAVGIFQQYFENVIDKISHLQKKN